VIVRLYEAWGERCRARVETTLPASRAYLCDLLERNLHPIEVLDGALELELGPFKVLTLKLEP
jgi:alpha-mannosidase